MRKLTINRLIARLKAIKKTKGNIPVSICVAEYYEGSTWDATKVLTAKDLSNGSQPIVIFR